jgi:hypothetical protein
MTVVFTFVFFFGVAATGLLYKVVAGSATITAGTIFALVTFVLMACAIFIGCYKLTKEWEGPETR